VQAEDEEEAEADHQAYESFLAPDVAESVLSNLGALLGAKGTPTSDE
jgi:hypothetical protein